MWALTSCGVKQVALQPVGAGSALFALELFPARRRRRHLDAAHLVEALFALVGERLERVHRVFGELGHQLRVVGLEDQARRVGGGAAGLEERPLVHHQDVLPAELRQVICGATAGDAGADDDDRGVGAHR
jgi:hypothetical protein